MKSLLLTKEIAQKVKETVECGLSSGLGTPVPGQMCIEAAVCYAYGLPHSDNPPCVGSAVRRFKIRLNDSNWSSNEARGKGMLKLSIAQLNSNVLDQKDFAKRITLLTINRIIAPLAAKYKPEIKENLQSVTNLSEAVTLCRELRTAAAANAAYAATYAAAANAADAAAYAAVAAAYAAAYAAAADAADAADAARDKILTQAADICLEVLVEMKSPGCEYLYLVREPIKH
jgi:hypothetical protein